MIARYPTQKLTERKTEVRRFNRWSEIKRKKLNQRRLKTSEMIRKV
jgi:hypothetical protein